MLKVLLTTGCLVALAGVAPAHAATVTDPTGDFLDSFVGAEDPDLDVTSFSVGFDDANDLFRVRATMAGDIDPAKAGLYVIGVNVGGAAFPGPFAGIDNPNVIFNRVIIVQKAGTATLSGNALAAHVFDNVFTVEVPLALFGAASLAPQDFGWNLWPRNGLGDNAQIADFAPNNATVSAAVPEPAAWALMIAGFGFVGGTVRRRHPRTAVPV